jgi:ABC-type hemin transport system ATPase subunit
MYLSERFNQLTGLTQRNLGMLNANFVVTPSVDEVLSFDFTDQERPWIGKLSQSKLSGAQRVLLTISFLLAVQQLILPQVGLLVLDEPTCHLDRFAIESLRDLFAGMQPQMRSSDMQVIVVDHCLELVSGFDKNVRLTRVLGEGNKNG